MKRLVDQQADLELDSKGNWSQCRTSRRSGVTWSYFLLLHSSLAAALRTDCRQSRRYLGGPSSRLVLRSTCDVTKAGTAALAASKGRDLMQPFRRRSWRKQRLSCQDKEMCYRMFNSHNFGKMGLNL